MATKWTQDTIIIKLKELHPNLDFSKFIFTLVSNRRRIIKNKIQRQYKERIL